jgi:hypothetical protein
MYAGYMGVNVFSFFLPLEFHSDENVNKAKRYNVVDAVEKYRIFRHKTLLMPQLNASHFSTKNFL